METLIFFLCMQMQPQAGVCFGARRFRAHSDFWKHIVRGLTVRSRRCGMLLVEYFPILDFRFSCKRRFKK